MRTLLAIALLCGASIADNSTFTSQAAPAYRGEVGSRFDGYDVFTTASFAAKNFADLVSSYGDSFFLSIGFSFAATLTPAGDLEDSVGPLDISIGLSNFQSLTELSVQIKTTGTGLDASSFDLEWTPIGGGSPQHLAPTSVIALNPSDPGEVQLIWDNSVLAGVGIRLAGVNFKSAGAGTVLDVVLIDTKVEHNGCATPWDTASIAAAGSQPLSVDGGFANAGNIYFVVGSATGTTGLSLNGIAVPITTDAYSTLTFELANTALLTNTLGVLDVFGTADASINIPSTLSPSLVGATVYHAAVVFDISNFAAVYASGASSLTILP